MIIDDTLVTFIKANYVIVKKLHVSETMLSN